MSHEKFRHGLQVLASVVLLAIAGTADAGSFRTCNGDAVILTGDPNTRISTISFPGGSTQRVDLDNVLARWNGLLGMHLEFDPLTTFGGNYGFDNGRNEIVFQNNIGSRGLTTIQLDACFWWFEDQHIQEFDIEFEAMRSWIFGAPDQSSNGPSNSFRYTAIHELGHALGLLHVNNMSVIKISNNGQSWYGGSENTRVHPHPDDTFTTRFLYPFTNQHRDLGASVFRVLSSGMTDEAMPNTTTTVSAGNTFAVTASFGNLGNVDENFQILFVLSTNDIISTFDSTVASGTGFAPPGAFHTFTWTARVPSGFRSGTYRLGLILDPNNRIAERIEGNNVLLLPTRIRVP